MRIEFSCTFEDYKTGIKAHRGKRETSQRLILAVLLFGAGAVCVAATFAGPVHDWMRPLSGFGIFCILLTAIYFSGERELRRRWRGNPNQHLHQQWDVNEAGIKADDGTTISEMKWTAFCTYLDEPTLFILYMSEFFFRIVPKRAFADDAQVEEFRGLLHRYIQPQTHAFPVIVPAKTGQIP